MFRDIRKKVFLWFFAALALLAVLRLVWYDLTTRSIQSSEQIAMSRQTIGELRLIFSDLQDARTAQRGYLLTGDEKQLDPFHAGIAALPGHVRVLKASLADDPTQLQYLEKLNAAAEAEFKLMQETIETRRSGGLDAAVASLKDGDEKALMDQARVLVTLIRDRWYEQLEGQVAKSGENRRWGLASFMILTAVDLCGLILGFFLINRYANQRADAVARATDARRIAEEASRAKTAFLGNMSHELRTPLNAIIGYSEMLAEDAEQSQSTQQLADLKKILMASRQLLGLINTLLDMSKVESGKMTLQPEDFAVDTLINDVTAMARPLVEGNRNRLNISCPPDAGTMHGDIEKTRQILLNLLSNAAKFTDGGKIDLNVHRNGRNVIFKIADTGIGMSSELIGRLFLPFEQGDPGIAARYGGTGLGLAISREFARLMGGDIGVTSQPGKGSTFTVTLPTGGAT